MSGASSRVGSLLKISVRRTSQSVDRWEFIVFDGLEVRRTKSVVQFQVRI